MRNDINNKGFFDRTPNKPLGTNFINELLTTNNIANIANMRTVLSYMIKDFSGYLAPFTDKEIIIETNDLANISRNNFEPKLDLNDYINLLNSNSWGGDVLFVFKSNLINLFMNAFYGAPTSKITPRKNSKLSLSEEITIEEVSKKLAELFNNKLNAVNAEPLTHRTSFMSEKLFKETNVANINYKIEFQITIANATSSLYILAPHKCYNILEKATQHYLAPQTADPDPKWHSSLQKEIKSTDMSLRAYINLGELPLSYLSNLQIGQQLALPFNAFNRVNIETPEKLLYTGSLGRIDKYYSVKINQFVGHEE